MYTYHAELLRVIDGDTVELRVDVGFRLYADIVFRLAGIDAPELRAPGPEGEAARDYLEAQLRAGGRLTLSTAKADKYGRWLARVTDQHGRDLNALMLAERHARPYDGGRRA